MTGDITCLLERLDCAVTSSFNQDDLERWGFTKVKLPFVKPATVPATICCPGCEEQCPMPVQKRDGRQFIWCDKPQNYGLISLVANDLKYWRGDMRDLARVLSGLLELHNPREIVAGRIYDIGLFNGHTLFLTCGLDWVDAKEIMNDTRIRNANPLVITLSPAPSWVSVPSIGLGQLLYYKAGKLSIEKDRLNVVTRGSTPEGNIFRREGDYWRIRYNGKEATIKHIKGMVYIDYLLHHPNQDVPAIILQQLANKTPAASNSRYDPAFEDAAILDTDPLIDDKALRDIQSRIEFLKETDPDSPLIQELDAYLLQGKYSGKSKNFIDDNERARLAVTKTISAAINNVKSAMPEYGVHLKSFIQTGKFCKYTTK